MGLLSTDSGAILIDGKALDDVARVQWRHALAYKSTTTRDSAVPSCGLPNDDRGRITRKTRTFNPAPSPGGSKQGGLNMGKEEHQDQTRDDAREKKPATSSYRLGREAKIGVVVIGLLLLGLGAAVAMRLCRAGSDDKQLAVADQDGIKDKSSGEQERSILDSALADLRWH